MGSWCQQSDPGAGRRGQKYLNIAPPLGSQRDFGLHVLQIVYALAVFHYQLQRDFGSRWNLFVQMGCVDFADLLLRNGLPRTCQFNHGESVHQSVAK